MLNNIGVSLRVAGETHRIPQGQGNVAVSGKERSPGWNLIYLIMPHVSFISVDPKTRDEGIFLSAARSDKN
jgi:hypothetical protein